jgi:hypothetical protein
MKKRTTKKTKNEKKWMILRKKNRLRKGVVKNEMLLKEAKKRNNIKKNG